MAQIKNVRDYEIVTDKDSNMEVLDNQLFKEYLKDFQSLPNTIEYGNVVPTDPSNEKFKSTLIQVIKDKYSC